MNGEHMAMEIREQPLVMARVLQESPRNINAVAGAILQRHPRFVLLAARGTSDHAAMYAKYLVETRLRMPAGLVSPSTMTVYDTHPAMDAVLFIGVSQSGRSPDLVQAMERARQAGAITLSVTNADDSPLNQAAEFHIDILAGSERAIAATKTYTAQLLSLFLLIEALAGRDGSEAKSLPERVQEVLKLEPHVADIASRYSFADQMVITSRGYNHPTAGEAALKLMETSGIVAHAFSGADLLHGPMAMIGRGFPVGAIVPPDRGGLALQPVVDRLRELHADTWLIGDSPSVALGTVSLRMPSLQPEVLSPLLMILPLQQFAWSLAMQRRNASDNPSGLHKVTKTW